MSVDDISHFRAHQAVKSHEHRDLVLRRELDTVIEEYRAYAGKHYNAAAINDLRLHYKALDAIPALIDMFRDEIEIIKRHGARENPWWDLID